MSLLIKALQKAEQGKHSEESANAPAGDVTLELAPMHAEPMMETRSAQQSAAPATGGPRQTSQQAASAMFKAKSVKIANAGAKRMWIVAGIGLLLLLGVGLGFYSYLQSLQQPALVAIKPPVLPAAEPQALAAAAAPITSPVMEPAPAPVDAINETAATKPASPALLADNGDPLPQAAAASQPRQLIPSDTGQTAQTAQPQQLAFGAPVADSVSSPVKVTRNSPSAAINPAVLSAYQAFIAGNDATAQSLYWQALRADTRNIDALLGMAAIAVRQGRHNDAAGWYAKVMEIEPRNTVAQAAMVSLLNAADPVANESRIKNLLAQKPEAAYLHAALGNLYAGQNQWPAAQQAYFDAYHFDNDNAEYVFNLAVSLDHLGKTPLALQYYKEAQALLPNTAVSNIDRAQLESRIAQLQ